MKSRTQPNAAFAAMTDDELEAELQRRKLVQITPPTPLANPDFSHLVKMVTTEVKELAKPDGYSKDFSHYIFEEVLTAIYGKNIWEWWNKGPGNREYE
jgi:hypothetical protein